MEIAYAEQERKDNLASNLQLTTDTCKSTDTFVVEMSKLGNYTGEWKNYDSSKWGKSRRKRMASTLLAMPTTECDDMDLDDDDDNDDNSISDGLKVT